MWKILNKFFGWQYVYWENSCDCGIERIRKNAVGEEYFMRHGKWYHYLGEKSHYKIIRLTSEKKK